MAYCSLVRCRSGFAILARYGHYGAAAPSVAQTYIDHRRPHGGQHLDSTLLTVLDQVQDKLGALNALPPRGCFFDNPIYIDDLVSRIIDVLKMKGADEASPARHK